MSNTMSCVYNKWVETMTGSAKKGVLNIQGAAEASLQSYRDKPELQTPVMETGTASR